MNFLIYQITGSRRRSILSDEISQEFVILLSGAVDVTRDNFLNFITIL